MAIIITDQYRLRQQNFLDDRVGLAKTTSALKSWDFNNVPIPDGFEVYVGGIWYVYKSSYSVDPDLGKFRARNTDQGIDEIEKEILELHKEDRILEFDDTRDTALKFSDLQDENFWKDENGDSHVRVGRIVTVTDDDTNNGPWYLVNSDYTLESSWVKLLSRLDIDGLDATDTKVYGTNKADSIFPKKESDETINGTWSFNKIVTEDAEIGNMDDLISDHLGSLGVGNLLKNTALTGQYESKEMENETNLQTDTDVYSDVKEDWNITTREVKIVPDTAAISGFALYLPNELAEVSQDSVIDLINNNEYVLSWKQKGTIQVEISDYEFEIKRVNRSKDLGGYIHYFARFTQIGNEKVTVKFRGGSGYLCDIKLEEGIIPTTWSPSPLDTDPVAIKINDFDYLRSAFFEYTKDESVSSLFLKNQIKVGEYIDGEVEKVCGGLSGTYNDDQDILLWSGSNYKNAQKLAQDLIKNPELLKDLNYSGQPKAIITFGSKSIFTDVLSKGRFYGNFYGDLIDSNGKLVLGKMGLNADLPFTTQDDNNILVRKYIGFVDGLAMSLNDRSIPLTDDNFSTESYDGGGSIIKFKDGLAYYLNSDTLYNSFITLYNSLDSSENTVDHILYFVDGYLKSITTEPYTYWY